MDDDHEERRRQIVVLLAYPRVGPLSSAAIAVNLGVSEDDIQAALQSLLQEGQIVRTRDGHLTHISATERGWTTVSGTADSQGPEPETRERG